MTREKLVAPWREMHVVGVDLLLDAAVDACQVHELRAEVGGHCRFSLANEPDGAMNELLVVRE